MSRKRLVFSLIILFTVMSFVVAEPNSYFSPFASCFSVDLASKLYNGAGDGNYTGDYGDDEMVGYAGVNIFDDSDLDYFYSNAYLDWKREDRKWYWAGLDTGLKYTVSVTFNGSSHPWMYHSVSNPELEIPFGLAFVVRYNAEYGTNGAYGGGKTYSVKTLGYSTGDRSLISDNDSNSSFSIVPGSYYPDNGDPNPWRAFWMDIVLVIPTDVRESLASNGYIQYGNADDYIAEITISITESTTGFKRDFTFTLSGYYGDYTTGETEKVIFNVTPNSNASSLNIAEMDNSVAVNVGEYYYSTEAYREHTFEAKDFEGYQSPFKLVVSSSPDPTEKGETFRLHLTSVPETNTSSATNIPFKIILTSDRSKNYEEFYGSDDVDSGSFKYLTGSFVAEDARTGEKNSVTFLDSGTIEIQFTDDVTEAYIKNLDGGYYSANIYFHLSSEW